MSQTYNTKETAERYDSARELPEGTGVLWMAEVQRLVPAALVSKILDLGGGTGRFAGLLHKTYQCPVVVVDPSKEMLKQGLKHKVADISWVCGEAEHIPIAGESIDFVWLCNVFHHLEDKVQSFRQVYRVLKPGGYLAIRNGTKETDTEIVWGYYFPEAMELDIERIPSQNQIIEVVTKQGFSFFEMKTVYQQFASSYSEYLKKISKRGLSSLISISDEAFEAGLLRLKEWTSQQPENEPVLEPIDLFVFRKQ